MKKYIFILALLIISCSNQESSEIAEGRIVNIEKGAEIGSFEFIIIRTKNKDVRFYSNNKNYDHYTYDHLISHQISGDSIKINYINESGKNLIISIKSHDH